MTTVQNMLARGMLLAASSVGVVATLGGCAASGDELVAPAVLESPFDASRGEVLLAVAPPVNESGVSTLDVLTMGDELVAAFSEARGLAAVPMNRTLAAMAAKGLPAVRTPMEAKILADALGVDGVVVSSVTAYDPYDPPTLGLALALFMRDGERAASLDPKALSGAYTDQPSRSRTTFDERPVVTVVEHLDASNHEVLLGLKEYATGRHDPKSALTWRRYTASMELYTQFAAYYTVRRLLEKEHDRRAPVAAAASKDEDTR
jgi:hypothetical protein